MRGLSHGKMDEALIPHNILSALWALKMTHKTQETPAKEGSFLITDNLYRRHVLVRQVRLLLDDEVAPTGTVRLNKVDRINCAALKAGIERLKDAFKGEWYLCQVLNIVVDENDHALIAQNAGYIV